MAKKLIEEVVIEEVIAPEVVLDEVLKSNWREILHNSLATLDASHLEKNAILPLINGLIK
tara:strand:+ start:2123 stop:2302 length:180 start_codon:yes stop_codon:yes gene_type:complete